VTTCGFIFKHKNELFKFLPQRTWDKFKFFASKFIMLLVVVLMFINSMLMLGQDTGAEKFYAQTS
jgi:uncharacterized membrane protein YukC